MKRRTPMVASLLVLVLALVLPGQAAYGQASPIDPVINEFVFNHTSTDTHEYVEARGDPNTDYSAFTILEIEGDSTGAGVIDDAFVIGTTDPGGYWTTGFLSNVIENGTVTLLLVESFTGSAGDDLDTDNDGVLDATPWTRIVDDVAISDGGSSDRAYATVVLSGGFDGISFTPGGASRIPDGADTDTVGDWTRNDFDGEGLPGFSGSPEVGEAINTPGAANQAVSVLPTDPVINEIRIDQSDADNDEYLELAGEAGASLDGLTYLVIGDGAGGSGVIEAVVDLSGSAVPAGGYFVAAESSFSLGTADLVTSLNFENSDNVTHLLVRAFSGANGNDLDTDDDGVLDVTPWSGVVDCVALVETVGSGDQIYCGTTVGPDGTFVPGHVFLCSDGWRIGPFSPVGIGDTPSAANGCEVPTESCGDDATAIYAVQGSGDASPFVGSIVSVEGIVTADLQGADELDGFFLQDANGDGDDTTSDGIFVYAPGAADVVVGEHVRVRGTVAEHNAQTEIGFLELVLSCGSGSIAPTAVNLPANLEPYEGMLVTFPEEMTASQNYFQGRYGQVTLSSGGRLFQPTHTYLPLSQEAIDMAAENLRRMVVLDDGMDVSQYGDNPNPIPYIGADNTLRAGDTVASLTGVLDYGQITSPPDPIYHYRLHPTAPVSFARVNDRTASPENVNGRLTVASFNVLNYFTTLDEGSAICGPTGGQDCRGADSAAEFVRQRTKIIEALTAIDADVVGLVELENHPADDPLADLVGGLNDVLGAGTYDYVATGPIGTDAIRVGFIYKPGTVTLVGAPAILDDSIDPTFRSDRNRPALAQTFQENDTGARFTAVVNHFKSKGSPCDDIGDPDINDGQGNCNITRTNAAIALASWLNTDPTGSGDPDFLILGDLNAYAKEDPITALENAGYSNLIRAYAGPWAYSYTFDGQAGYLDHALASPVLVSQVTGATEWHINTDEPSVIDYNLEYKPQDLYTPTPYRASDHDPVIVGLDLNAPPDCSAAAPSIDTIWPVNHKFVTVDIVGVTDPEGNPLTLTVDGIYQDEPVNGEGEGNTAPDGAGIGEPAAQVRAEREGGGNGRVYHVYFTASDGYGTCSGELLISVPHSKKQVAVDDGALYDSTEQ